MNTKFRDHVTSASFSLTLSKNMITILASIRRGDYFMSHHELRAKGCSDTAVPSARHLRERGLIEPCPDRLFRVTRAGELVLELLVEADLVERISLKENVS